MQTFLPYQDFKKVAKCLDNRRLFKQVVEAKQIYDIKTTGKTKDGRDYPKSMKNHPIVKAWWATFILIEYHDILLKELRIRKFNTKMKYLGCRYNRETNHVMPWMTDEVCEMYQAHLVRKNPEYYKFNVDPTIPFNWELLKI